MREDIVNVINEYTYYNNNVYGDIWGCFFIVGLLFLPRGINIWTKGKGIFTILLIFISFSISIIVYYKAPRYVMEVNNSEFNTLISEASKTIIEVTKNYKLDNGTLVKDREGNIEGVVVGKVSKNIYECKEINSYIEENKCIISNDSEQYLLKFEYDFYLNENENIGHRYKIIKKVDNKTYLAELLI